MDINLEEKIWWDYLEEDIQELLRESFHLTRKVNKWDRKFHDYAFIVFPASKAYEGFLKKLFLDMGFISREEYLGRRFRIGKALNPSLDRRHRVRESVYDKLVEYCGGRQFADKLWITWREARNLLFHWFPEEKNAIDYEEAKQRVNMIIDTIDLAFKECKIDNKKS